MYTGRQLISELDDASSDLDREARKIRSRVDGYRQAADALAEKCLENLRKIADIIIREGVGVPNDIKRMLEQRESRLSEMRSKLSELEKALPGREEQALRAKAAFDTLNERLKTAIRDSESQFYARQDIVRLQQLRKTAENALDEIGARLERARRDLKENAKDYESDPLFMYLKDRNYLSGDYKGRGFVRVLDAWLARITHFADNIGNYQKLHRIPEWVEERRKQQKAVVDFQDAQHDTKLAQAMKHLDDLKSQTSSAKHEFNSADDLMKSTKSDIRSIGVTLDAAEKSEDDAMDRIVAAFTGKLDDASSRELSAAVSRTKTTEDDRLFDEIRRNRAEISELHQRMSKLSAEARGIDDRANEIESVISRIRRNDWDDSGHKFNVSRSDIVDDLLRGSVTAYAVSSMLESSHIAPPPPVQYHSGSSWNDDSSNSWSSSSGFGSSSGGGWSSSDSISNDSGDSWKTDDSF